MNNLTATTVTPATAPAPTTIINLPIGISPGAAGRLWSNAVTSGRTIYFFQDGQFIGSTEPDAELGKWLRDPNVGTRHGRT